MLLVATLTSVECGHLSHPPAFVSPSVGVWNHRIASGEERRLGPGFMRQTRASSLLRLNMVSVGDDVVFARGKHAGKKGTVTLYQTSWYSVELTDGSVVKSRPGNLQVGGGSVPADVAAASVKPRTSAKKPRAKKVAVQPKGRKKTAAPPKAGAKAAAQPKAGTKAAATRKVKGGAAPTRHVTVENSHFFPGGVKAPAGLRLSAKLPDAIETYMADARVSAISTVKTALL
ncbi:hypothetical protein T484DRAFT_1797330, partial [Baffinella frigidus]